MDLAFGEMISPRDISDKRMILSLTAVVQRRFPLLLHRAGTVAALWRFSIPRVTKVRMAARIRSAAAIR